MKHSTQTADIWQAVPLARWQWNETDPTDPDLELVFWLPARVEVRVNSQQPLRLAQYLAGKRPSLRLIPRSEGMELWVTVGLSLLFRLPSSTRDRLLNLLLPHAVQVHTRTLDAPSTGIHLAAPSPIQFHL